MRSLRKRLLRRAAVAALVLLSAVLIIYSVWRVSYCVSGDTLTEAVVTEQAITHDVIRSPLGQLVSTQPAAEPILVQPKQPAPVLKAAECKPKPAGKKVVKRGVKKAAKPCPT